MTLEITNEVLLREYTVQCDLIISGVGFGQVCSDFMCIKHLN